jgi:predicted MFS family arabinose efflux permease
VLYLTQRHVPERRGWQQGRLDWAGAALAIVGLGGLVSGLILSSEAGWRDARVAYLLSLVVLALAVFSLQERRHPARLLPLHLFHSRDFSAANLLTLLLYAALAAAFIFCRSI